MEDWPRTRRVMVLECRPSDGFGPIIKAAVGVLLILSMLAGCAKSPAPEPGAALSGPDQTNQAASGQELPIKGSAEAPVVLAVFCDFV